MDSLQNNVSPPHPKMPTPKSLECRNNFPGTADLALVTMRGKGILDCTGGIKAITKV